MSQFDDYDSLFKVLVLGEPSVGKTCLLRRFVDQEFTASHKATIGVDFKTKTVMTEVNGLQRCIKLQMWDTGGQERFMALTQAYFRGTHAAIVVFSLADMSTFDALPKWLARLDEHNVGLRLVVGNKSDLKRCIDEKTIAAFCTEHGNLKYVETSALNGENVTNTFQSVAQELTELLMQGKLTDATDKTPVRLAPTNVGDERVVRKGCCGGNG